MRGTKDGKQEKQGIVPPQAPKREWEAIRALPEIFGRVDTEIHWDEDILDMPWEPWKSRFKTIIDAAVAGQILLKEYEAQSQRLERAVELLKSARGKLSVSWDEAMDLVDVIDCFLREPEGK